MSSIVIHLHLFHPLASVTSVKSLVGITIHQGHISKVCYKPYQWLTHNTSRASCDANHNDDYDNYDDDDDDDNDDNDDDANDDDNANDDNDDLTTLCLARSTSSLHPEL